MSVRQTASPSAACKASAQLLHVAAGHRIGVRDIFPPALEYGPGADIPSLCFLLPRECGRGCASVREHSFLARSGEEKG